MTATRKILIGAGVAAGVYVLYKLTSSSTATLVGGVKPGTVVPPATAGGQFIAGLLSGLSAPVNGPKPIGPAASGGSASPVYAYGFGSPTTTPAPTANYIAGPNGSAYGNQQAANNYAASDASGGTVPLPTGVYGPAVPAPTDVVSDGSGDSLLTPDWSSV